MTVGSLRGLQIHTYHQCKDAMMKLHMMVEVLIEQITGRLLGFLPGDQDRIA